MPSLMPDPVSIPHAVNEPNEEAGHRVAIWLCILGYVLHLTFSQPVLDAMGLSTASQQGGNILAKIHPGSYFVFLAFFAYLAGGGNPLRQILYFTARFPASMTLLLVYVMLGIYWAMREPSGVGLLPDTHMTLPMAAIIFSTAPREYCRKALYFFIFIAALNSAIGIVESIGRFRVFTFSPDWVVLREQYFRASALGGHPLNNAMLTGVAIFITVATPLSARLKGALIALFTVSLVAFGGRAGLGFSVLGLAICGLDSLRRIFVSGRLSMAGLFGILALAAFLPLLFLGSLNFLLRTGIGERLAATSSLDDESAQGRWLAFNVFDVMTHDEIIMGVSGDRTVEIAYRLGLILPISDIENPWVLLVMLFGAIGFTIWLFAAAAFFWSLLRGQPLPLQLAALIYFIIASTSNSFARKDSIFLIMVCSIVCAARVLERQATSAALLPQTVDS